MTTQVNGVDAAVEWGDGGKVCLFREDQSVRTADRDLEGQRLNIRVQFSTTVIGEPPPSSTTAPTRNR